MADSPPRNLMLIAYCGTNCAACEKFAARSSPVLARELSDRWHAGGGSDQPLDWFQCKGCRRDAGKCVDPDCPVRQCSAGRTDQVSCAECPEFACATLLTWAEARPARADALERLRALRSEFDAHAAPT